MLVKIHSLICRGMMNVFGLLPIKGNKIVFTSYYGKYYNDSPRYIFEAMAKKNKELDYVWLFCDESKSIQNARTVKKGSIRSLYELATARVWIDNCRKPLWMKKRESQYYVQTWHAGISNKAGEMLAQDKLTSEYVKSAINDSDMANLFISNSRWLTKLYRDYFWYSGDILEVGLPRDEMLYRDYKSYHKKICKNYGVDDDVKFVLYAPTFRNDGDIKCYDMDYEAVIKLLSGMTNKKWKMIIRLHPNIKDEDICIKYNDDLLNGSQYDDINELILASDYVISDYSSCLYDAILADKITIIYASDMKQYKDERGFIVSWEETPFPIAESNEELLGVIKNIDIDGYKENITRFIEECGVVKNKNASYDVADYILKKI